MNEDDIDFSDLLTVKGTEKFFLTVALYGENVYRDATAWFGRSDEEKEEIIAQAAGVANTIVDESVGNWTDEQGVDGDR